MNEFHKLSAMAEKQTTANEKQPETASWVREGATTPKDASPYGGHPPLAFSLREVQQKVCPNCRVMAHLRLFRHCSHNYLATIRTVHRTALHPRQAAQPFHLVHLADFHAGHGVGGDGADRGAVGDERLSEGNPRAHAGRFAASGSGCGRRAVARLATRSGQGCATPASLRRRAVCRRARHAVVRAKCAGRDGARYRSGAGNRDYRTLGQDESRRVKRFARRGIHYHARLGFGAHARRQTQRQGHADRPARADHSRRDDAAPQAISRGGHFRDRHGAL